MKNSHKNILIYQKGGFTLTRKLRNELITVEDIFIPYNITKV